MSIRRAACFAALFLCCATAWPQAPRTITLDAAFTRALDKHPQLARYEQQRLAAAASVESESQGAPLRLELELENAPQSGTDSTFEDAEITLSLASAFERGGKREARQALASARQDALSLEQEQRRTDLLAEVARRYLDLLAVQSLAEVTVAELTQRELMADAAARRVRAGAAPDSVRLAAEAAVARARLMRDRGGSQWQSAAHRLALMWNSREPDFERCAGDPLALPAIPSLAELRSLLEHSPDLRRFADESRLREARLQLARSSGSGDIEWRAGIRRLELDDSWAAVAGISLPLGSGRRSEPGVRAAQAELTALSLERESESLSLEATLIEAHLRYSSARAEVATSRDILLPKLGEAGRAAERAYRAGALTHTEWSQVQTEILGARRELLLAALDAHRALIEIQRLTGATFISGTQP